MPLLQAYAMNLECVSMFYVVFAEATGVNSISSKIGSFPKESTMDTIYSPIEVMNANCFHKFAAGTMKEHLFINLRHASFFLELSLFPAEELPQVQVLNSLDSFNSATVHCFPKETGNLVILVCLTVQRNQLIGHVGVHILPVWGHGDGLIFTDVTESTDRKGGSFY